MIEYGNLSYLQNKKILLEDTKKVYDSALCEHIRSINYESRNVKYVEHLSNNALLSIITLMSACIEE